MTNLDHATASGPVLLGTLINDLNVAPELVWGVAQRLHVGAYLTLRRGFSFTSEEAEQVRTTVRMLLRERNNARKDFG